MDLKETISLLNTSLNDAFTKKHIVIFAKLSKDNKQIDFTIRGPDMNGVQHLYDTIEEGLNDPSKKGVFSKISSTTEEVLSNTEEEKDTLSGGSWSGLGIGNGAVYLIYKFK